MTYYVRLRRSNNRVNSKEFAGMIDLAVEVVTAIASGAAGSLGSKGTEAAGRLLAALRAKFRGHPASRGALEISVENPDDDTARYDLISMLREHIGHDAEFAALLAKLWNEIRSALEADAVRSANPISGTVHGSAIQARDVQGGIHLSPDPR